MFLIVVSHFAVHSPFEFSGTRMSLNQIYTQITVLGNVGVNVFVLISSTFLFRRGYEHYSPKRVFPLWRAMLFYSIIFYAIFVLTETIPFSTKDFIKSLFPISFETWWFGTTYIILFLFYPFLNILIDRLDKRYYILLLAVVFIIWCIVPTLTGQSLKSNDIIWFVCLYFLAGFLEKQQNRTNRKPSYYFLRALLFYVLYCISIIAIDFASMTIPALKDRVLYFSDKQRLIILPLSVYLFLGFRNMKEFYSPTLNQISRSMFGVYLISEYPTMREYIWSVWNPVLKYTETNVFILFAVGYCALVFILCSVAEMMRLHTIEVIMFRLFDRFENAAIHTMSKFLKRHM